MASVEELLEEKYASLEEVLQKHSKMLKNCKRRQGMRAGCDDKASTHENTLPAARVPLGDIVDLLGGEGMIKYTQGLNREQLEMFFTFLSNTGYVHKIDYHGRKNETQKSLCKRSRVNGVNETKADMVYRVVKALSANGNVEFGWAVKIQEIVSERKNTLRVQAAQKKEANDYL